MYCNAISNHHYNKLCRPSSYIIDVSIYYRISKALTTIFIAHHVGMAFSNHQLK